MPIGISTKVGLFSHDENARKHLATIGGSCTATYVACVPPCVPITFLGLLYLTLLCSETEHKKDLGYFLPTVRGR